MYQRWENSEGCAGRLFCDLEFFIDKGLDIGGLMGEDVDGSGVMDWGDPAEPLEWRRVGSFDQMSMVRRRKHHCPAIVPFFLFDPSCQG